MAGVLPNDDLELESNFSAKNTDISSVTKDSTTSTDHFIGVDRIREQVAKAVGNDVLVEQSMLNRPGVVRNKMDKERKIGHRRVGEGGEITYKKIQTTQIMGSIQLGIQHTVGSLASKPKRDLLMMDFWEMETISFPPEGSSITPAHHYSEFRFKIYAPIAFRYFRDLFGIQPDDFMMSMCSSPLRELSNPGASGSIFYLTDDDEFIIKTVQHKEGEFLQKLLPGYYMNLNQNPRTLLPKFFGLYCYQCNSKNVRLIAMNNLLPSFVKMHLKYDLKGSTYKRKASKGERSKKSPTYKDLDFMEHHPNGLFLEADTYTALIKTIQRDCRVLESFKIMDYSLLVGVHNLDTSLKEKQAEKDNPTINRDDESDGDDSPESHQFISHEKDERGAIALNRSRSINRQRIVAHSTAMESIQAESEPIDEEEDVPPGGIPARSENGERLLLFIGIIDILQSYRLKKKLEHTFKSIIHDGDTVSVHRPSFYAQRFQDFMAKTVFKKIPSPLKHSPSKRKSLPRVFQKPVETEVEPNYPSTSHQQTNIERTSNSSKHDVNKVSPTTKSSESLESEFSKINNSNSATLKQNVSKIQAPLPPLKKKMGIVKQNVPPPVPPRGSPRAFKHQSPKSGVTFNSDIKTGNVSPGAAQAHSCSSTPPPAFDDISDYGNSVQRQSDEHSERRFSSGYGTRGSNYRDDTISISEIRLDNHLGVDTSCGSSFGSRGALAWTPPTSVEGSTPTWTEGTPSFTDSSSSGEIIISGGSSPLHSSNVNGHHKPRVEHALSSLTSEMTRL